MTKRFTHSQQQLLKREQSILETGFRRYEDYINHGDKHDALEAFLDEHLPRLFVGRKHLRILDIGVGSGRITKQILRLFEQTGIAAEVIALEPSHLAAQSCLNTLGVMKDRVTLQKRPFSIGSPLDRPPYDFIMASHVSYYFEDKDAFVQQVMNSLAKGGFAIFVAASINIMQNELYRTILHCLRARTDLPRTFDSDGLMDYAEQVEYALFEQNIVFRCDILPSKVIFTPDEMLLDLECIEAGKSEGGPVLKAISFLWRYSVPSLLTEITAWRNLFREQIRLCRPLQLVYEDIVLTAEKSPVIVNK